MKRKRFTERQIIGILKKHEAGMSMVNLSRRHNVSTQSLYRWRLKYGGMEVSEAKRLRALEAENARLKRRLTDAMQDNAALQKALSPK